MIFAVGAGLMQEDSNGISRPCPLAHMYVDDFISNFALHHINSLYTIIVHHHSTAARYSFKGHYIYTTLNGLTDLYAYIVSALMI